MTLVSVIIPTLNRPQLLLRAISSVLSQSYQNVELIVVVDGPDDATIRVLQQISDERLRIIVNPRSLTAAGARNVGVDHAKGEWIAFLDDDDEWLLNKIEKQLAFGLNRGKVLITTLSRVVTPSASVIQPKKIYDNLMPLDEYLFDRRSPFVPPGFVQTSSYLMPRSIFDSVRFSVDSPHDDWDFILRLSKQFGVRIETLQEVLVVVYSDERRQSLSNRGKWVTSLAWINEIRPIITKRAYGCFCMRVVGARAANEQAYRAFGLLLYQALRYGSPRPWQICVFVGSWLLPNAGIRWLKALVRRRMAMDDSGSNVFTSNSAGSS
jgi:glycosyltransferase involved in cell wall biosynthesis